MGKEDIKFYNLAPVKNADIDIYTEALDYSLEDNNIKNVAITGIYGAGKSSLIESYKEKKKNEKDFIHISLAHFNEIKENFQENINEDEKKKLIFTLEAKILNQLIHQISPKKIPQTNFKIKNKISKWGIFFTALGITLLLLCSLYLKYFWKWSLYANQFDSFIFKITIRKEGRLFSGLIIITIFFIFCFNLIKKQKYKNLFRKLNIQGNEIEISEDSTESCFDKYLNEVLYLFEQSNVKVVVFEDIDRFDIQQIFERLREINLLVNNRLKKENKILKFFYLLKDDVFISKERTKFFDFIIPVIPVIDSSNSYNKILRIFSENEIDKIFLKEVSLFIDDMRLLLNIHNEFIIYKSRLNNISLNLNKLLGIIIYKNLFPKDFGDLQLNQGFIFGLFKNKASIKQEEILKINDFINNLNKEKGKIENIYMNSIEEINKLKSYTEAYPYYDSDKNRFLQNIFPFYEQGIQDKKNNKIGEIEEKINKLKTEQKNLHEKFLYQIITVENIEEIFNYKESGNYKDVKENKYFDLLKYLIRKGYIDENYSDYMTYFYENNMKKKDKQFIMKIINYQKTDFDYCLENPKLVIEELAPVYFDEILVFNYDLFNELLSLNNEREKLLRFIKTLKKEKEFNFIREFFNSNKKRELFILNLVREWNEIFKEIIKKQEFTNEEKHLFSIELLYYCDNDLLTNLNIDNILKNYIEENENFLKIENPQVEKLIEKFKFLDIKFKKINFSVSNSVLFEEVYKNSMYLLNLSNINLMLKLNNDISSEEDLMKKNYTSVEKNKENELFNYVKENINEYFEIILKENNEIEDELEVVINVLNNENILKENKIKYIENLKTKIIDISKILLKEYLYLLLDKRIASYNSKNIMTYFKAIRKELDQFLIDFINSSDNLLNFEEIDESEKGELFDKIILCNDIKDNNYRSILKELAYIYDESLPSNIPKEKVNILIKEKIITMSDKILEIMRTSYKDKLKYFIETNIEKYLEMLKLGIIICYKEELLEILDNNEILEDYKIDLLKITSDSISLINKNYSLEIQKYILKEHYDETDFEYLVENYDKYDKVIKENIYKIVLKDVDKFSRVRIQIPKELLNKFLRNKDIHLEEKLPILLNVLDGLSNFKEFRKYLNLLKLDKYLEIFTSNQEFIFEVNYFNRELFRKLYEKRFIEEFEEVENKYRIKR